MKKSLILFACLAAWCFHVAAQGSIARYEWWVDGDFASRTAVTQAGTWTASLNLSALHEGLHRLEYQAVDNEGRRSAVAVRHFIKVLPPPTTTATTLQRYEYWLDGDYANVVKGNMGNDGIISLSPDFAALHEGLHRLEFHVYDNLGRLSSTAVKYFIKAVPDPTTTATTLQRYEYWLDGDYANVVKGNMGNDGIISLSPDFAALHEGLHRLEFHVYDNLGRLSSTAVKYFIKAVPDPTTTATTLQRYEYWFDGDKDNATSGEIGAGGIVTLALELADIHPGLHKFECRVFDSAQQTSATMVKYFIVRDLSSLEEITPNLIAKYAYWFNHGKRVEFVVDPPTPTINVTNQVIELKDIVPNMVGEDYEFDLAKKLLYVTDDVLVAVQVFDKYGTGSVPDTTTVHDFVVPVDPHFRGISPDEEHIMPSPKPGMAQGYIYSGEVKDSLEWVIRGPEMPVDFYDEQGNRLQPVLIQKDEEATIWGMRIPTAVVYAIARDAEVNYFIDDESSVELVYFNADPGDVNRDGQITAVDLSIVVNIIAGLDNAALYRGRADVNRDGEITAADIGMIVNIIAGLGN